MDSVETPVEVIIGGPVVVGNKVDPVVLDSAADVEIPDVMVVGAAES